MIRDNYGDKDIVLLVFNNRSTGMIPINGPMASNKKVLLLLKKPVE